MDKLPRVCVIGAGSSGIAVAKALHDRSIPFDCYEKSDRVGGNWVFKNKNGVSSAYRSLHINTSKQRMQYADYPMPANYPDFPHHSLIAAYFDSYVEHFGFRQKIRFETGVNAVRRLSDGVYEVCLDNGKIEFYDAIMVANGHHWDPLWPTPPFPGEFDGVQMHSHDYIDPSEPHDLRGKRVVVLGMGNSAMDIACELSRTDACDKVFLAARRGAHIIPKYILGKPLDQGLVIPPWLGFRLRRTIAENIVGAITGKMEVYGLPRPDHRLGEAHPTISSEILTQLGHGDITPKPNIARLDGDSVTFTDGSREKVDAILYCTGYRVSFPFFDEGFISAPHNDLPLFLRVHKPGVKGLFFIGLLQPLGATMPIAEAQGKWLAEYLCGETELPDDATMRQAMRKDRKAMFQRYVPSKRHTMQVDFESYMWKIERELKKGRRRAQKTGHRLPVPARAYRHEDDQAA